jgi:hypothetical protein
MAKSTAFWKRVANEIKARKQGTLLMCFFSASDKRKHSNERLTFVGVPSHESIHNSHTATFDIDCYVETPKA